MQLDHDFKGAVGRPPIAHDTGRWMLGPHLAKLEWIDETGRLEFLDDAVLLHFLLVPERLKLGRIARSSAGLELFDQFGERIGTDHAVVSKTVRLLPVGDRLEARVGPPAGSWSTDSRQDDLDQVGRVAACLIVIHGLLKIEHRTSWMMELCFNMPSVSRTTFLARSPLTGERYSFSIAAYVELAWTLDLNDLYFGRPLWKGRRQSLSMT